MLNELWSDLRYRVRALFRRDDVERELDAELRFHLEREADELERRGMRRAEALRQARLDFGGVDRAKEESRDARGTMVLESFLQDARYALRGLRARPGFTAGVVITLALGIGANAAMFGIMDALLFRPPAYLRDVDRVHRVYLARTVDREQRVDRSTRVGQFLDFRRYTHVFSTIAAFATWHIAVGDRDDVRERPVSGVSAAYFDLFDARPTLGRFFTAIEDSMPTGSPVVVLGHAYWQTEFGGRRDVLGRQLRVGRLQFTVIGVAPPDFVGLGDDDVPAMYIPLAAFAWNARPEDHTRDYHWVWPELVVKRANGVTTEAADADLTNAFRLSRLSERPGDTAHVRAVAAERPRAMLGPVRLARGPLAGPEVKVVTWVTGVAVIVLLIAAANVANLLLSRAIARRREIALRLALGVSRGRLVRQLLTESLVLTLLGGLAGLVVAQSGGGIVRALFLPTDSAAPIVADRRTLGVTLVATIVVGILTGLAPALHALGSDLVHAFGAGARDTGGHQSRSRSALIALQAALSVVLLVGAGLFIRSLSNVRSMHLGYDVERVVVVTDNMRGVKLSDSARIALEQLQAETAATIPGVVSATPAPSVPFWAFEGRYLHVAGIDSVSLLGDFLMQAGNTDYFRTMGTRILRGRAFTASDRASSPRVTVVSERMARVLWPGRDPLGQCIRIGADTAPCTTVVGVAEDLHLSSLIERRECTYYVPLAQYPDPTGMILVRVTGDAEKYAPLVRKRLQLVMPGSAYVTAAPLREMVEPKMQSWRLGATMFVTFGVLALTLAAVGLYGVIAFGVAQRRREIGVRIALGARTPHILSLVMQHGLRPVIVGAIAGGAIAMAAGPWLAALLFNESARDPVVYGLVGSVLLGVAVVATGVPALTAAKLDPNITLRAD